MVLARTGLTQIRGSEYENAGFPDERDAWLKLERINGGRTQDELIARVATPRRSPFGSEGID